MKEFLVKTNYGYTYMWTAKQVAEDYAVMAIQQQAEMILHDATSKYEAEENE
jgi:hypothetical protein